MESAETCDDLLCQGLNGGMQSTKIPPGTKCFFARKFYGGSKKEMPYTLNSGHLKADCRPSSYAVPVSDCMESYRSGIGGDEAG
jgi:hypothetical protein